MQAWRSAGPSVTSRARDWDWIIDVNLKGVVYGMETFVPLIKSHGEGGHIVNTASMAGMISPPNMEPYSATKFAVVAMSEGWFMQLAPENIGVSVLCPGFVRTRIHESGRVRQDKYGGNAEVDSGIGEQQQQAAQMVLIGIDPDIVGERVVEAIQANELYIFTHPPMRDFVQMRFAQIMAAFDSRRQKRSTRGREECHAADADEALAMKFGIFYEHQLPRPWNEGDELKLFQDALDQVELADRLGIDHAWEVEHHFLEEYSHSSAPEVFLAACSQRTKNIRLGHGIVLMPPGYNHPARVAERIATLDLVSNGRVEFGTGESSAALELGGYRVPVDEEARRCGARRPSNA